MFRLVVVAVVVVVMMMEVVMAIVVVVVVVMVVTVVALMLPVVVAVVVVMAVVVAATVAMTAPRHLRMNRYHYMSRWPVQGISYIANTELTCYSVILQRHLRHAQCCGCFRTGILLSCNCLAGTRVR